MLYGPMGGGVARYLKEKRSWLARNSPCRHSLLVPGPFNGIGAEGEHFIATWAPNEAARRWPWRVTPWFQAMLRYAPDIIEVEDPGLVGWIALHAARELGIPLVAFCHSELVGTVARRLGPIPATVMRAYLRSFYRRCDLVLTPSEFMRRRLLRWGVDNVVVRPLGVDLPLDLLFAVLRIRMSGEELGLASASRCFFQDFHDANHRSRVVACLGHKLHAQIIGL